MSYSVYLLHLIVLLALIHLLYGKLPVLLIDALCLAITLAVSWGFYRQIEIPLITLGRRLSAKL
jgi:peptidoglycan/LPS O-acetylase OafA/YrhL